MKIISQTLRILQMFKAPFNTHGNLINEAMLTQVISEDILAY